jgi:CDP-diacylglycerol--glycerol-3-phosphate 3-phosphatidyltransferase
MGWANRITICRAVTTLGVWVLLGLAERHGSEALWTAAFWLFVVSAATDTLDGAIARRLKEESVFGRIADPLVDKLLVLGTMIFLLGMSGVPSVMPAWTVAVMLAREFLVTAVRGAAEGRGINFQAVAWGKGKMLLQCVAVGAVILHRAGIEWTRAEIPVLAFLPGPPGTWCFAHVCVWAATLVTGASGIAYAQRAMRVFRAS